ncbi:TetR/AcrR family transcriptional regulator [Cellulomonas soli]|uniref:TetR family transcriptional regulator n=1 Tax=Cellulomonas soli TaxID=931535 RepID=A0A512PBC1_9CELL|nr:TetR/AcrR family transcriptional regulator [Cellulomonas soli]NYI61095.1 AcrR family transcriptional regulator [Cellulomonas soli]GEP68488.1 TetR family transcriptional regulator [Cellulomonas soli]
MHDTATRPDATPAPVTGAAGEQGLRARQKQARQRALVDAAHLLVARDGLDAVTVEAICEQAGVSTRTFFNYFATKDDAVLGHMPLPIASDASEQFAAGGPTGSLTADLEELLAQFFEQPPMGHERMERALALARGEPRLLTKHLAWMERHRGELVGLIARRLGSEAPYRAETVAGFVMCLMHATFTRWDAADGQGPGRVHLAAAMSELRAIVAD